VLAEGDFAGENPYRFSTKYYDQETDLYYYGYRYYAPKLGRWICVDPIGEKGGLNLYAILANNSIDRFDFLGFFEDDGERYQYTKENGIKAHNRIFWWMRRVHVEKDLYFDRTISGLGLGLSRGEPDIVDKEEKLIWEIKTINHVNKYDDEDYNQVDNYLDSIDDKCYYYGFGEDLLFNTQGIVAGQIKDGKDVYDVKMYWADRKMGFIFYKLVWMGDEPDLFDQLKDAFKKRLIEGPTIQDYIIFFPPGPGGVPVPR
jgi:RHS repeat-associated protein